MSQSVNTVILMGTLGKDVEIRRSGAGFAFGSTSLATEKRVKVDGQTQKKTHWHKLKFLGKSAEYAADKVGKGSVIAIVGELETNSWTDKEGKKQYTVEVLVNQLSILKGKAEDEAPPRQQGGGTPAQTEAFPDGFDPNDDVPF